jgi:GYF domain 2
MHWYVNVENKSYGPYSDDQMRGFVAEGRITTSSLISNAPQSGFYGATEFDDFNVWSGEAQQDILMPLIAAGGGAVQATTTSYAPIQPVHPDQSKQVQPIQQYEPQPYEHAQSIKAVPSTPAVHTPPVHTPPSHTPPSHTPKGQSANKDAKSCVFLIMAEISSDGEMAFLQALQSFGQTQRLGDTVWLVRSSHSVEQIRNTLSQTLNQQDRLFILNSKAGKTAWFNIGTDLDHRIRELWDEEEG